MTQVHASLKLTCGYCDLNYHDNIHFYRNNGLDAVVFILTCHITGCPNCKQKRIKCSEELPACHNCIKKNYHCGYLDYSEDKLEKLRKKNQDKLKSITKGQEVNSTSEPFPNNALANNLAHSDDGSASTTSQGVGRNHNQPLHLLPPPTQGLNLQFENARGTVLFINDGSSATGHNHHMDVDSKNTTGFPNPYQNQASLLNPHSSDIVNGNNFVITPPFAGQPMSMDSSPYSDSPNNVDELFSSYFPTFVPNQTVNSITPPNIFEYAVDSDYDYFNNAPLGNEDLNLAVFTDSIRKLSQFGPNVFMSTENVGLGNPDLSLINQSDLKRQLAEVDAEKTKTLLYPETGAMGENEQYLSISPQNHDHDSSDYAKYTTSDLEIEAKQGPGESLPNAKISNTSFQVLRHPNHIKLLFTRKAISFQPDPNIYTLSLHQPDWTRKDNDILWTITLGEALVLHHAFFSFFVDRGLCVILKVCDNSVKSSSSVSCFTPEIQKILTKKSYAYFGRIIRNLRMSVNEVDVQTTTIGSWYAGWSLILHKRANAKATTLFYGGSASLLWNCLNNCKHFDDLDPRLRFISYAVRNHTSCAVIPDYKIDVIHDMRETSILYKKFVNYNTNLTTSSNGYILKYYLDMENFLNYLLDDLYPRFVYIDNFYKEKNGLSGSTLGIRYFSPSLLYELINRWLRIIPSHARSIGREMSPLKRTFYLFYIAVGKALANVFPIIRSAFLVDTWDTLYPQIDFDYHLFKYSREEVSDESQYNFLSNCASKLLRTIKFFTTRQQVIAHILSTDSVLKPGESFIQAVDPVHDESRELMKDIAFMVPEKRDFGEIMLNSFTINTIVNIYNYPKLVNFSKNLSKGSKSRKIIERENHNQKVRIAEYRAKYKNAKADETAKKEHQTNVNHAYDFDFERGMFLFDYAVEPIVEHLLKYLDNQSPKKGLTIEELKGQILNFESSHKNMFRSIDNNATN